MKNNKGFTLVELVVVVAILLALATLATVSVTGVLNKSNDDIDTIQNKMIEKAALACLEEGECDCDTTDTQRTCKISSQTLIDNQFLDPGDASGSESVEVFKNSDGSFNTVEKDSYVNNVHTPTSDRNSNYDYIGDDTIILFTDNKSNYDYGKKIDLGILNKGDIITYQYKCEAYDETLDTYKKLYEGYSTDPWIGSAFSTAGIICDENYREKKYTITNNNTKNSTYYIQVFFRAKYIKKLYIKNLKVIKAS